VQREIEVLEGRGSPVAGERVECVVALGRALSDPIRVGMLAAEAAEGRGCCGLPDLGAPVSEGDSPGICVCEFEECFDMGQSSVQNMNVLMVGDIVGPGACRSCAGYTPWIS
jgi:hypothetical protein